MILVYKPEGITPLQIIEKIRRQLPEYADATMGYAGRLDPLAQGLLLLLVGEENKNRKSFERLPKTYTFRMICGIETDTHDLMGIVSKINTVSTPLTAEHMNAVLTEFVGVQKQPYPLFSSARVNGKPLYYWARAGRVPEKIPEKSIEIFLLQCTAVNSITLKQLSEYAVGVVSRVDGTFRQAEIIETWKKLSSQHATQQFPMYECTMHCSSGTYVRKLVDDIGKRLGIGAIAHQITRSQIGEYTADKTIVLEQ